jgi:hypothetical protein
VSAPCTLPRCYNHGPVFFATFKTADHANLAVVIVAKAFTLLNVTVHFLPLRSQAFAINTKAVIKNILKTIMATGTANSTNKKFSKFI